MDKKHHKDLIEKALNTYIGKRVRQPKIPKPVKRRGKKNNMAEKKIERDIISLLNLKGYIACKSGEGSTYNAKHIMNGMSDILVFVKGYGIIFMEVKTDKGRQRNTQVEFEKLCQECNLYYTVVRSTHEALKSVNNFKNTIDL